MKVIQFINQLGNGGAEKFCVELSNELAKQNEVILCSVQEIEEWMIPPTLLEKKVILMELGQKKYSFKGYFKIFRILKKERPEIVHIHSSLLFFYFSLIIILFKGIKFVHTIHATITPAYNKLYKFLSKISYLHKNLLHVCISKDILRDYQKSYPNISFYKIENGIAPMKTTPQLNEVKKELGKLKNGSKSLFIAIGNYSVFKNFPLLVSVFTRLYTEGFLVSLIILGEDTSADKEQWNLVQKNKLLNIFQIGIKKNVADYLYCSDALVMSSLKEGMPLVILEAMSLGNPIISTPAGGVVDMVEHGINGCLARGFAEEDLYDAILEFIKFDRSKKEEIQKANLEKYSAGYSMELCSKRYLNLYNQKGQHD